MNLNLKGAAAPLMKKAKSAAAAMADRKKASAAMPSAHAAPAVTSSSAAAAAAAPQGSEIRPSTVHADGIKRCWGETYTSTNVSLVTQHDMSWGNTNLDSRHLFKILCLEVFQCGLTWSMIIKKLKGFEERFHLFDYRQIATWGEEQVAEAMADAGIVRNMSKIRATIGNAQAAVALDERETDGFKKFFWRTCCLLPDKERLLQTSSRSGTYMRSSTRVDYEEADGVHPTVGVAVAAKEFKRAGFKFLGPCTMLSFMQEVGAVNHHSPDCDAFERAEAAYARLSKEWGGRTASFREP